MKRLIDKLTRKNRFFNEFFECFFDESDFEKEVGESNV